MPVAHRRDPRRRPPRATPAHAGPRALTGATRPRPRPRIAFAAAALVVAAASPPAGATGFKRLRRIGKAIEGRIDWTLTDEKAWFEEMKAALAALKTETEDRARAARATRRRLDEARRRFETREDLLGFYGRAMDVEYVRRSPNWGPTSRDFERWISADRSPYDYGLNARNRYESALKTAQRYADKGRTRYTYSAAFKIKTKQMRDLRNEFADQTAKVPEARGSLTGFTANPAYAAPALAERARAQAARWQAIGDRLRRELETREEGLASARSLGGRGARWDRKIAQVAARYAAPPAGAPDPWPAAFRPAELRDAVEDFRARAGGPTRPLEAVSTALGAVDTAWQSGGDGRGEIGRLQRAYRDLDRALTRSRTRPPTAAELEAFEAVLDDALLYALDARPGGVSPATLRELEALEAAVTRLEDGPPADVPGALPGIRRRLRPLIEEAGL